MESYTSSTLSTESSLAKCLVDICGIHPGKKITHFCKTLNRLCCRLCKTIEYGHCNENLVELSDIASSRTQIADDHKAFNDRLHEVRLKFSKNKKKADAHLKEVDEMYETALVIFKGVLENLRDKEKNNLKNIIRTSEEVLEQINKWEQNAGNGVFDTEKCKNLFVLIKSTDGQLDNMCGNFQKLCTDNKITRYAFATGEISTQIFGPLMIKPYILNEVNVQCEGEEKLCVITDILHLGNELILVSDRGNKSIKLVNVKTKAVISRTLPLNNFFHQMTLTDNEEVYATVSNDKTILKLTSPKTDLRKGDVIPTRGNCFAIEYQKSKLNIQECTSTHSYKIVELDPVSKAVKTRVEDLLPAEKSGFFDRFKTFGFPLYTVQEKTSGDILYSCHTQNIIVSLSSSGETKTFIRSDKLEDPHGIEFNRDGSLLVACTKLMKIVSVTKDGCTSDFMPKSLDFKPVSLRMDRNSGILYIGGVNNNVLMVAT